MYQRDSICSLSYARTYVTAASVQDEDKKGGDKKPFKSLKLSDLGSGVRVCSMGTLDDGVEMLDSIEAHTRTHAHTTDCIEAQTSITRAYTHDWRTPHITHKSELVAETRTSSPNSTSCTPPHTALPLCG
jgi:hypothetical protein